MEWYVYVSSFFAGAFLGNAVPHFVQGVSGNKFPSPFASPPGRGLSSPLVNVVWGLCNIAVGYALFLVGQVSGANVPGVVVFFAGVAAISILSSVNFQKKDRE